MATPQTIPQARLLRDLRKTFRDNQTAMSALHGAVQIKPTGEQAIRPVESISDDTAEFECRPVVCLVPERASSNKADIYIVFTGKLMLRTDSPSSEASTVSYATNFAYFKTRHDQVTHALGGHYDFTDSDLAHPRAHLQLRSQADMWTYAEEQFHSISGLEVGKDSMAEVLSRVRSPSAQMDFLSFMIQIAADHLVDGKSGPSTRNGFKRLTETCVPFLGYEVHSGHKSWNCHRAAHWYTNS